MSWTTIRFRKFTSRYLPELIIEDGDFFFHAYENNFFHGDHEKEADYLDPRARSIKVPSKNGKKMLVEYLFHPDGKFGTMQLIPDGSDLGRLNVASSIDFYVPRTRSHLDKTGYKNFVFALKAILFRNPSLRMNRRACEAFFNDDENFDLN